MRPRSHKHPAAFTLLELVVVLAILAVVTSLAVRAVDKVADQRLYEENLRLMRDIEGAVLGYPDERAMDGTRMLSGFVADMGRLPKTVEETVLISGVEAQVLTLGELWRPPTTTTERYDVRPATAENIAGGDGTHADASVQVASGWRGPYLTLPMGEVNLRDGWGSFLRSLAATNPPAVLATEYPRLRTAGDVAITTAGVSVEMVRHLGADGVENTTTTDVDVLNRDGHLSFAGRFTATVKATVQLLEDDGTSPPINPGESIIVRVFGPGGDDGEKISIAFSNYLPAGSTGSFDVGGVTSGSRVVRAYLYDSTAGTTLLAASAIKHVVLQPGVNFIPLTIYR